MCVVVNGVDIFAKGANWIPADARRFYQPVQTFWIGQGPEQRLVVVNDRPEAVELEGERFLIGLDGETRQSRRISSPWARRAPGIGATTVLLSCPVGTIACAGRATVLTGSTRGSITGCAALAPEPDQEPIEGLSPHPITVEYL